MRTRDGPATVSGSAGSQTPCRPKSDPLPGAVTRRGELRHAAFRHSEVVPVTAHPLPAGLDLRGRAVAVIGGGAAAAARLPGLLAAGARVHVVAPELTPVVEGMAAVGEITWRSGRFVPADLDEAWLAVACTGDPLVDAAVAAEADRRRVFCLGTDPAAPCSVRLPATGEHDGVRVAVFSGDGSRRASTVRTALLEAMQAGAVDGAAEPAPVGVALVGGGPGDPELITVRGRRLLARADVVVADRLGPRDLLDELGPHVEVVDASKIPYGPAMAQERINELLVSHARAGRFVVRLKGGDPFVFGRGYEEVIACTEAGVPVTVVPGVTSAVAVPALAGVPVSHRGVAHEIVVISGHFAPDDPRSLVDWSAVGRMSGTVVLMMAVERIDRFADALVRHGRPDTTPVAVVQDGSTRGQRCVRATLATVAGVIREEGIRPPAIVVVGPVAGLDPSVESWCTSGLGRYGVPIPS